MGLGPVSTLWDRLRAGPKAGVRPRSARRPDRPLLQQLEALERRDVTGNAFNPVSAVAAGVGALRLEQVLLGRASEPVQVWGQEAGNAALPPRPAAAAQPTLSLDGIDALFASVQGPAPQDSVGGTPTDAGAEQGTDLSGPESQPEADGDPTAAPFTGGPLDFWDSYAGRKATQPTAGPGPSAGPAAQGLSGAASSAPAAGLTPAGPGPAPLGLSPPAQATSNPLGDPPPVQASPQPAANSVARSAQAPPLRGTAGQGTTQLALAQQPAAALPAGSLTPIDPTFNVVEGAAAASPGILVAGFTDTDGNTDPSRYTATIAWGDGQASAGTVAYAGGAFQVTGNHAYAEEGNFAVTVTVLDSDGAATLIHSTGNVADAPLARSGNIVPLPEMSASFSPESP